MCRTTLEKCQKRQRKRQKCQYWCDKKSAPTNLREAFPFDRYSRTASVENMISNGGDTTDEDDDYDYDNGDAAANMSYEEEDRIRREKRAIKFTFLLAMVYLVCLLPLNILKWVAYSTSRVLLLCNLS